MQVIDTVLPIHYTVFVILGVISTSIVVLANTKQIRRYLK